MNKIIYYIGLQVLWFAVVCAVLYGFAGMIAYFGTNGFFSSCGVFAIFLAWITPKTTINFKELK